MEPRIQYAKSSDGVNIAYTILGKGPPIVIPSNIWGNVHFCKQGLSWTHAFDQLASLGWSVITYDGRGSGASDRDVEDYSLEARMRDLEAVIERAALERFALCGMLQGSPTAIAYAVTHPNRVTGLVLSNAFASGSEYYKLVPAMRLSQSTLEMAEDDWEFHMLTMANAVAGYSDADLASKFLEAFRTGMTAKGYLAYRRAAAKIDVQDLLPELGVRTLVVLDGTWGPSSSLGTLTRQLAAVIPDARYVDTNDLAGTVDGFLGEGQPESVRQVSGQATTFRAVLFTDLVGHTEMMSRLGDERGRDVLREHERITREVLKANGGTEVKTMGDGFMASFGSVTKAVECAVALQHAFSEREGEPLNVRVGLNAGEPIEEDGDLFGATVILASRIAAKADGGEILVSDTVRGLCSGKGFLFADRGEFVAKGFEEPVRISEVNWRG